MKFKNLKALKLILSNINSLILYVIITIISDFAIFYSGENNFLFISTIIAGVLTLIFIGSCFKRQGSRLKNLLSFSLISVVCLIAWMGCALYVSEHSGPFDKVIWSLYGITNPIAFWGGAAIDKLFHLDEEAIQLIFLFFLPIPSLLMWLGLEYKSRKINKQIKIENNIKEDL